MALVSEDVSARPPVTELAKALAKEYEAVASVKALARKHKINYQTVRRLLLDAGVVATDRDKQIDTMVKNDMTINKIANTLSISINAVMSHRPHSRGSYARKKRH
jgi:DNA-binding transcriptional regulator YhcF (GntR family)